MKHARTDYDHIQDPSGKIPQDEPVFLLRGQDKHAPAMLEHYQALLAAAGQTPSNSALALAVQEHRVRMLVWQDHQGRKAPDMPESAMPPLTSTPA